MEHLSFGGVRYPASSKKFDETILIVPFFGSEKENLKKHWEFFNSLGYDCVIFSLHKGLWKGGPLPVAANGALGIKHAWADQVEQLLNEIPGKKIVFAFSNPSCSAIEAIARRHAVDVKGLACDSGPSGQFWSSMEAYFKHEEPIKFLPLRWAAASVTSLFWSPRLDKEVHEDIEKLPKGFPILSIRGWRDPLIPPEHIDKVFEPHPRIDWRKLSLPEAVHLNGLRDFPDDYKPAVTQFLAEISKL